MSESSRSMRVVVDTNFLVSAALSMYSGHVNSPTARLFKLIAAGDVIVVASTQTCYELADKLQDPDFALPASFILAFVSLFTDAAEMVSIRGLDMGCKGDPDDNMFVETAVNGRVDCLITYDHEFDRTEVIHELSKRNCKALTAGEFCIAMLQVRERAERVDTPQSITFAAITRWQILRFLARRYG